MSCTLASRGPGRGSNPAVRQARVMRSNTPGLSSRSARASGRSASVRRSPVVLARAVGTARRSPWADSDVPWHGYLRKSCTAMVSTRPTITALRVPTPLARRPRPRMDPVPDRTPAPHQDHRPLDAVLARPEPQVPPLPAPGPQSPRPGPPRLPRQTRRPHLLGIDGKRHRQQALTPIAPEEPADGGPTRTRRFCASHYRRRIMR